MSKNNREVVHLWAQQNTTKRIKGNNIFAQDRSLYSYSTEIARFIEGRPVYTSHRYSVTTTGKHSNQIPGAVSHLEAYRTPREMKSLSDNWEEVAPLLFIDQMVGLQEQISTLKKARSYIAQSVTRLVESAFDTERFREKYLGLMTPTLPENALSLEHLTRLLDTEERIKDTLKELFNIDIRSKLEKEEVNKAKLQTQHALKLADQLLDLETKIAEWRAGTRHSLPYNAPTMLRVTGAAVETSRGAKVSIPAAKMLWGAIATGRNVTGYKIGEFTVTSLDTETLTVGCHSIPISEVYAVARELGFDTPQEHHIN